MMLILRRWLESLRAVFREPSPRREEGEEFNFPDLPLHERHSGVDGGADADWNVSAPSSKGSWN
jgi:hypothetical protein